MSLSNNKNTFSSLPTLLLLEGSKFPSFNFSISSSSNQFKIKYRSIYLYSYEFFKGEGKAIPLLESVVLGAVTVTITDVPAVIPEIENIIKLNGLEKKNVLAKPLDWENRLEILDFFFLKKEKKIVNKFFCL